MKHNNISVPGKRNWLQNFKPPGTTNLTQRERVQHGKLAGTFILIVMLLVLALFPQAILNTDPMLAIALSLGLGVCVIAFFLNRKGLVRSAGILTLIVVYTVGTFTMLHYPHGLTASDLYLLVITIIPDVLVLAFFPANSLFPIVCINALQTLAILTLGPHDSSITQLLQTRPVELFSHVYILQLITAAALYLWARNTEHTLAHADRSKEAEIFSRHNKEWQQKELAKKRLLDDGIQQILQTHIAVANGDLNARAPLLQDHDLWQVASALNNLIARHQSLSYAERKFRQQIWEESHRNTDEFLKYEQATGEFRKYGQATGEHPNYGQATGEFSKYRQATGELPKYRQATGELPRYPRATRQLPKLEENASLSHEAPPNLPRRPGGLFKSH